MEGALKLVLANDAMSSVVHRETVCQTIAMRGSLSRSVDTSLG